MCLQRKRGIHVTVCVPIVTNYQQEISVCAFLINFFCLLLPSLLYLYLWFILTTTTTTTTTNYHIELLDLVQIQDLVTCIMSIIIIAFQKLPGFTVLKRTDNESSGICKLFIKYWTGVFKEIWDGQCISLFNTILAAGK